MNRQKRYNSYAERLESYQGWPRRYIEQTPESLAAAGFFYIGSADRVTCFSCHKTLRDWRPGQDPLTMHREASPDCNFVKTISSGKTNEESFKHIACGGDVEETAGDSGPQDVLAVGVVDFPLKKVKSLYQGSAEGTLCPDLETIVRQLRLDRQLNFNQSLNADYYTQQAEKITNTNSPTPRTPTPTKPTCNSPANENSNILKQIDDNSKTNKEGTSSTNFKPVKDAHAKEEAENEAVGESWRSKPTGNTKGKKEDSKTSLASRLKKENIRLKRQRLCKVCYKTEANILVLPCSHIVFCSECVENNVNCVKCGTKILGTVKVFLV